MKKRLISVFLVLVLSLALLALPASAATSDRQILKSAVVSGVSYQTDMDCLNFGQIVFYPDEMLSTDNTYPIISWANGTVCPTVTYYRMCSKLAAHGYIVVASTELMSGDGTDQIASVDYMIGKNADPDSIFYNHVDTENIGVCGHSQGGRSCVCAAKADDRIDCVVSIAGSSLSSEYKNLETPAFYITGTADLVVWSPLWVKPAYNAAQGPAVYAAVKMGIHTTVWFASDIMEGYAASWFDAFLKGDTDKLSTVFASGGELANDSHWTAFACKGF